jgi:hypothetical protein
MTSFFFLSSVYRSAGFKRLAQQTIRALNSSGRTPGLFDPGVPPPPEEQALNVLELAVARQGLALKAPDTSFFCCKRQSST